MASFNSLHYPQNLWASKLRKLETDLIMAAVAAAGPDGLLEAVLADLVPSVLGTSVQS